MEVLAARVAARVAQHLGESARLLDRAGLANRLRLSERGVTGLVNRGELPPGYLIGGARRWDWAGVLRHLNSRAGRRPRRGRGRGRLTGRRPQAGPEGKQERNPSPQEREQGLHE
jgi:hypothetical protein